MLQFSTKPLYTTARKVSFTERLTRNGSYLDPGEVCSEPAGQESIGTKRRNAHKAAQIHQLDALQVVQSQLVIEQLCKPGDLIVVH